MTTHDLDDLIRLVPPGTKDKSCEQIDLTLDGKPRSWPAIGPSRSYLINRHARPRREGLRLLAIPLVPGHKPLIMLLDYRAACRPGVSALQLAQALHRGEHPQAALEDALVATALAHTREHPRDLLEPQATAALEERLRQCGQQSGLELLDVKLRPEGIDPAGCKFDLEFTKDYETVTSDICIGLKVALAVEIKAPWQAAALLLQPGEPRARIEERLRLELAAEMVHLDAARLHLDNSTGPESPRQILTAALRRALAQHFGAEATRLTLQLQPDDFSRVFAALRTVASERTFAVVPLRGGQPHSYTVQVSVIGVGADPSHPKNLRACWKQFIDRRPTHDLLYDQIGSVLAEQLSRKDDRWHEEFEASAEPAREVRRWIGEALLAEFGVRVDVLQLRRTPPCQPEVATADGVVRVTAIHAIRDAKIAEIERWLKKTRARLQSVDEELTEAQARQSKLNRKLLDEVSDMDSDPAVVARIREALARLAPHVDELRAQQQQAEDQLRVAQSQQRVLLGHG